MKNIVDEKQFGAKEAIKIISSLNASWKLLVSEVLKLVKLILLVLTTNAASERSSSTLCRVKTYLWSSMTHEPVSSCLIALLITFQLKNRYFPRIFTETAAKGNQRYSSVETRNFVVYINIYILWFTYMIYMIYCYLAF